MSTDWQIPAESPLAGLAYAVAQEKLLAVLQQAKVDGPRKFQARSLREAQAFCYLMRKTRVALLQDGVDLDVLVAPSGQAESLGAGGVSLISFELSEPNFSDKGLGAGPASLIPPHGFVALAMRTIMEVESERRAGGPGDAEKVDLAVDGILDVLKSIPLDQSSVPPEAFGDDAFFQSLSPEKKAQFTRAELVRLVGQLRALASDPGSVQNTRFFIAGQRPVKIEDGPRGRQELAIDWKTGEFVETDLYIEKIFRDHSPDIDEVDQATFDQRVTNIREEIGQQPELASTTQADEAMAILNAALRLESTAGFNMKFSHPGVGELCLPMDHSTAAAESDLAEPRDPPQEEADAFVEACQLLVNQKDLLGAYAEADAFLERYPLFVRAHHLQGAYAEGLQDYKKAAFHLRKCVAIHPGFLALTDLGRVLGKAGETEQAVTILGYLFKNRAQAPTPNQAVGCIVPLLYGLARLKGGKELRVVSEAAIAEHGPNSVFQYHAILGAMLSGEFEAANQRLLEVEPRFNPEDPLHAQLMSLKEIIGIKLAEARPKTKIIGFELVLGGPGLSGTLENFTFRETGITALFGEDPNSRVELGFDSPTLGALLKELQACSFPSLGQNGANGAAPDTLFRTLIRDASGKNYRTKGKVFSRKVLADSKGPSAEALQSIMHWVEGVWHYRSAGDLAPGLHLKLDQQKAQTASSRWKPEEVQYLEYEIGNEHSPTDSMGRQVLRFGADDTLQVTWIRRSGRLEASFRVRVGLMQSLIQQLHDFGFPGLPGGNVPAGASCGTYRLKFTDQELVDSVYPATAQGLSGLRELQNTLNRLTRELVSGPAKLPDSGLILEREEWR